MLIRVTGRNLTARAVALRARPRVSASVRLVSVRSVSPAPTQTTAGTLNKHPGISMQPIALGMYASGVPDYASLLDSLSAQIGRKPTIVMWYRYWSEQAFSATELQTVNARGEVPMVTWEPWTPDHTSVSLKGIAAGSEDATIIANAKAAAAWGKPVLLRFAQEMNGHWFPWGLGVNGNTASDFIAAWRHIVTTFRAQGATNVRWVWSPNEMDSGVPNFQQLYPGDAFVDWVAIDGYNFGSTPNNTWQSFGQIFGPSYAAMSTLTSKPLMVAETGSVAQGGNKPAWITSTLQTDLPRSFPRIRALVWFDKNYNGFDWRADSSSSSLSAFRAAVNSSQYSLDASSLLAMTTS